MTIILDIDGVLVPAQGWKAPTLLDDGFPVFSSNAISALQSLLIHNPTIILSSSHRDRYSIGEWKKIFATRELSIDKLSRLQPRVDTKKRKQEIEEWISRHHLEEHFVIIDDDQSLNGLPEKIKQHLVVTSPLIGLTPDHIPVVEEILQSGVSSI